MNKARTTSIHGALSPKLTLVGAGLGAGFALAIATICLPNRMIPILERAISRIWSNRMAAQTVWAERPGRSMPLATRWPWLMETS